MGVRARMVERRVRGWLAGKAVRAERGREGAETERKRERRRGSRTGRPVNGIEEE